MASVIMVKIHSDNKRGDRCRHYIGYSFRLAAMSLLYAPSHRQHSTYHGLCYTSHVALAGMRNSSMGSRCNVHAGVSLNIHYKRQTSKVKQTKLHTRFRQFLYTTASSYFAEHNDTRQHCKIYWCSSISWCSSLFRKH